MALVLALPGPGASDGEESFRVFGPHLPHPPWLLAPSAILLPSTACRLPYFCFCWLLTVDSCSWWFSLGLGGSQTRRVACCARMPCGDRRDHRDLHKAPCVQEEALPLRLGQHHGILVEPPLLSGDEHLLPVE